MRKEKVLIVEFEDNSLSSLSAMLEREGFHVVTARDGHEGLVKFESEAPDLVILEPMLLKLHGFDLCKKISSDTRKKTPVIITTAFYKGEQYRSEALGTFGAAAFFEKPYDKKILLSTIHDLLGNGGGADERVKSPAMVEGTRVKSEARKVMDIEQKVREIEASFRHPVSEPQPREEGTSRKKGGKQDIDRRVDEMLKDALSEFGISMKEKASAPAGGDKKIPSPEEKQEMAPDVQERAGDSAERDAEEEEKTSPGMELEGDTRTEELIRELMEKGEEGKEAEEEKEINEREEGEGKKEEVVREAPETGRHQAEQKLPREKEIASAASPSEGTAEPPVAGKLIFEGYFDHPKKTSLFLGVIDRVKKVRLSRPVLLGAAAFLFVVVGGTGYYLFKSESPGGMPQSGKASNVSSSVVQHPETSLTAEMPASGDPTSSSGLFSPLDPAAEISGTFPGGSEAVDPEASAESVSESVLMTPLASSRGQVVLPAEIPLPETREFEVVEVREAKEAAVEAVNLDILSPPLEETARKIVQSGDPGKRIKTGDLVPIESVDVPPVPVFRVNPKYPPSAFAGGVEQTVVFRVLISEFGNVLDIAFVDSSRVATAFTQACREAVRQWKFRPAQKNGVNVKVWKTFTIIFKKKLME